MVAMAHVATAGTHSAPVDLHPEATALHAFAAVTGAAVDPERPVVPPTFLPAGLGPAREYAEPQHWPGIPLEQDHRFFGPPPRAGERLRAQSRVERVHRLPDAHGELVTVVELLTRYFDRTGRLVAESWLRGARPTGEPS